MGNVLYDNQYRFMIPTLDVSMEKLRVLVADAHTDVRHALQVALPKMRGIASEVNNDVSSIDDLLDRISVLQPDILLLDWQFLYLDETHLAEIHRRCPSIKIIALSIHGEMREIALRSGADAFVNKADGAEHLISTIQHVIRER